LVPETAARIQAKIENYNHDLQIIIAGMVNGTAHIYEILNPGTSRCFDSIGFDVIGSGLPHAMNTLVARGCNQETPLEDALLIVYEAKKMAEKAPGVGANITDMCIIDSDDTYILSREKIDGELNSIYEKWRAGNDLVWKSDIRSFIEAVKNGK
jgi:20S proteasome alpha/beta subunit